jgi:NADH:ubiquinone oxidoreductase subunit 6 (subunit J)
MFGVTVLLFFVALACGVVAAAVLFILYTGSHRTVPGWFDTTFWIVVWVMTVVLVISYFLNYWRRHHEILAWQRWLASVTIAAVTIALVGGLVILDNGSKSPPPPPYSALVIDFGAIGRDLQTNYIDNASERLKLETDCQHLLDAVQAADSRSYSHPSLVEDPTAGREWSDFVISTESGASECVDGIQDGDQEEYLRAPVEMNPGFKALVKLSGLPSGS